jgi:hypothetical protein
LLRGHLEFALDFVLMAVAAQIRDLRIGWIEIAEVLAGEIGHPAALPELGFAFDFAFGLRRGRVTEVPAVEAQGPAQLRQGVGGAGKKRLG